jgi:hypothetical protein
MNREIENARKTVAEEKKRHSDELKKLNAVSSSTSSEKQTRVVGNF